MDENLNCENVANIEKHLRKVDYIIRRKGREILSDFNITVPQFSALQILINYGDMTIGELSQKMALACSTITDLIDRMEKSDLVIRKKDEKDKRVVRVEVLPKGYDILEKVLKKRIDFLTGKLSDFSDEDKDKLNLGLKSLYEAMKDEI
ncbi:MarR family winged helix-turn-helix transcriptional regulator [Tissierella praeacuta]|uniref:DNA-binding transcriptional regulator, MarR family n=1 Tax=Tissierella praeacuta DSM 18095 TaxID=1123404 RepID=A0A1M4YJ42_9FIRM|nr:MarR family transcriptional regulator [Tissierella praeacuta]MBU5255377.1 MarR family transcriptional regulator [Tissierella praeacuta]SHF05658.1 DNA-binding transcriptional regulator, MarR family [Tissierella praeacuta DSM 18095]SUP01974.1 Organic hydroperoxide resistance transcriptional regulator [Tissierella praeacuta]